jgi:1,4-dihydroxy-2-naphthoate octaprenyltransferase
MNERNPDALKYFFTAARPSLLLGSILFYALGAGIVHFLGNPVDWSIYMVGQAMILLLQLSSYFLFAYFNFEALQDSVLAHLTHADDPNESLTSPRRNNRASDQVLRLAFLQAGLTTLTIGAVLTVMMSFGGHMNVSAYFLIGVALVTALIYATPPTNFGATGYGDLIIAVFLAIITPAFAYVLQAGEVHRLLTMLSFPLSAFVLAGLLALSLEDYQAMLVSGRRNLMTQMGWQRGMQFHNTLILLAYLLFGVTAVIGLPWALTWPAILTLPVGLFQIWQMRQIANGAKPHWRMLRWTAYGLVAIAAYLLSLALWTA